MNINILSIHYTYKYIPRKNKTEQKYPAKEKLTEIE